jgi:hypothetical protein
MAVNETRLAEELSSYKRHKEEWLAKHRNKYVVLKGSELLDFFPSFEAAYQAGVNEWGVSNDFLVKQIVEHEPVFFVF